jgi:hypothetical protein
VGWVRGWRDRRVTGRDLGLKETLDLIIMANWQDWLRRAGQYGKDAMAAYGGVEDASTLGQGLAERARMQDAGNAALQMGAEQPAPMPAPVSLAPYERVNPGYQPIGGSSALRQTLAGQPPKLR